MEHRTKHLDEWESLHHRDLIEFDGVEPTHIDIRTFGAAAVYLDRGSAPALLLGAGASGEFSVHLNLAEPHKVYVLLEQEDEPAAFRARRLRHTPNLHHSGDPGFLTIKQRSIQSEEVKFLMRAMQQQAHAFERRMREVEDAGRTVVGSSISGSERVIAPDGTPVGIVPAEPGGTGGSAATEGSAGTPDAS